MKQRNNTLHREDPKIIEAKTCYFSPSGWSRLRLLQENLTPANFPSFPPHVSSLETISDWDLLFFSCRLILFFFFHNSLHLPCILHSHHIYTTSTPIPSNNTRLQENISLRLISHTKQPIVESYHVGGHECGHGCGRRRLLSFLPRHSHSIKT